MPWIGTRSLQRKLLLAWLFPLKQDWTSLKPNAVSNSTEKMSSHPPRTTSFVKCLDGFLVGSELFCWLVVSFALLLGLFHLLVIYVLAYPIPCRKPLGGPSPQTSTLALGVVLIIVVIIQTIFNAWQDFSTARVIASIKGMLPSDVLVLRDGGQTKVPAKELVPGDLVTISMGEKVPADLRLIEVSADLQFNRSILTGEASFFHSTIRYHIQLFDHFQSEPVSARVNKTDENFLEVGCC